MGAEHGFKTTFAKGDGGGPEIFSAIANITNISPFNITRETHDSTDTGNTDEYKTVIGGLKDSGECSIDLNYKPTDHNVLIADFDAADPLNYQVTFPNGEIATFAAVMTGFTPTAPQTDKMTATITFKISGKIVWT